MDWPCLGFLAGSGALSIAGGSIWAGMAPHTWPYALHVGLALIITAAVLLTALVARLDALERRAT